MSENQVTQPISFYGINKLLIEKYLALYAHAFAVNYQVLRVSNPYGPFQRSVKRQGLVAEVIDRLLHRRPIEIWGDGKVVRDFIHIDDVIDAFLRASLYEGPHRVMNVGSGIGRTVLDVVRDITACFGEEVEIRMMPGRNVDVPVNVLDVALITQELSWRPRIGWQDGLRSTIRWLREQEAAELS